MFSRIKPAEQMQLRKRKIQSEINEKLLKEFSKLVDVSPDIPKKAIVGDSVVGHYRSEVKKNEFHGLHQETK
ncbi:MAG TPA: hypothetical protein PKN29_01290 [Candidatus Ozemobacteraceae bacterium]|nr:hypothetical protein [Candidatus Ozemobacteraceae bacterium]